MTIYVSEHYGVPPFREGGVVPLPVTGYTVSTAASPGVGPPLNANTGYIRVKATTFSIVAISTSTSLVPTSTNGGVAILSSGETLLLAAPKSTAPVQVVMVST